ncbi:MAG: SUMF1/EgtB/PvdO family nonheme iron enzyme [Nannocystaceae bacterium]
MSDADAPARTPAGHAEDSVFIAYSRQDGPLVDVVVKVLRARGVRVLWDRDIHGGAKFQQTLAEWIKSATVFVVLLTSHSVASDEVKNEIRYAKKYRRHRLPLLVEGVVLPLDLDLELAITNIVTVPEQGDAEALADLVEGVLRKVGGHGRRQVEAPPPEEAPLPVPPPARAPVFADVPSQPQREKPASGTLPGVPTAWVRRVPYLLGALVLAAGIGLWVRACDEPSDKPEPEAESGPSLGEADPESLPEGAAPEDDQELAVESSSSGDSADAPTGTPDVEPKPTPPIDGMVWIEPGEADGEPIEGFYLDRTEVTVAAYRSCVEDADEAKRCTPPEYEDPSAAGFDFGREGRDQYPVNAVTWAQADAYCRWLGRGLPTERQWEWAALGRGNDGVYPWGSEAPGCDGTAEDRAVCGIKGPLSVGSRSPQGDSRDGVQDLAGNVREWTASTWSDSDPGHVLRGGGYASPRGAKALQSTARGKSYGVKTLLDVGFRCAWQASCPEGTAWSTDELRCASG